MLHQTTLSRLLSLPWSVWFLARRARPSLSLVFICLDDLQLDSSVVYSQTSSLSVGQIKTKLERLRTKIQWMAFPPGANSLSSRTNHQAYTCSIGKMNEISTFSFFLCNLPSTAHIEKKRVSCCIEPVLMYLRIVDAWNNYLIVLERINNKNSKHQPITIIKYILGILPK